jgi:threonine dehydrogenase-like Zn-dependent dehydrogenase
VEEAPVPAIGPREALVRNRRTLISRGSEIGRRYLMAEAVDPAIMGYSAAGVVAAVGAAVAEYVVGQRVVAVAPHAEYIAVDVDREDGTWLMPLPDEVSFERGAFHPLATGATMWAKIAGVQSGDTVAVLGQGLVGSLVMQALRPYAPGRVIAIDALANRRALAAQLGADVVIDAAAGDPVAAVLDLTGGNGADVVIDCVGGRAGVRSFAQALDMCRPLGRIHLIALYHGEPLPLDSSKLQRRLLIGGYYTAESRRPGAERAMAALRDGSLQVAPLITHRFPYGEAKAAFDLLYERPGEALGVIFDWD